MGQTQIVTGDVQVRWAEPQDALALAAMTLRWDLDSGAARREGFLAEFADAWLATRAQRPAWIALLPDGNPVGMVVGTLVTKLPSLRRPATRWMHIGLVYVDPDARGQGVGRLLLDTTLGWCRDNQVERVQLNATDRARNLYRRSGFGAPDDRLMSVRLH